MYNNILPAIKGYEINKDTFSNMKIMVRGWGRAVEIVPFGEENQNSSNQKNLEP